MIDPARLSQLRAERDALAAADRAREEAQAAEHRAVNTRVPDCWTDRSDRLVPEFPMRAIAAGSP